MKIIKKLLYVLSLLLVCTACDSNEYEIPAEEISDLYILTSAGENTVNKRAEVDKFFSFSDLSQGTLSRKWTIPEGNFFLKGPIPNNLKKHDKFIINAGDTTSVDQTIHVLFKKGNSLTEVKYFAIFEDSTEFEFNRDYDLVTNSFIPDTIRTEKIDDKWIAEYTFIVDVYDTVVATPELRFLDGTIIDHQNTEPMTVRFGDQLIIEDVSAFLENNNARPNVTKWRIHTIEENEDERKSFKVGEDFDRVGDVDVRVIDTLTFVRLGEFQLQLRSERSRDEDLGSSNDTYEIPKIFNILPLDEDLVLDNSIQPIIEFDDNRIAIPVSSILAQIENDNVAEDFTVKVDGDIIPVNLVTIANRVDASGETLGGLILLTLDTPLVPADAAKTVTVSYNGTSIMSRDERLLQGFENEPIIVNTPSPLELAGDLLNISGKIVIPFNQRIDPESITNSSDPSQGFSVLLNGMPATISSVEVSEDSERALAIDLDGGVFDDDDISVEYVGPGDILSLGGGSISDFSLVTALHVFPSLIGDSGMFEQSLGTDWIHFGNKTVAGVEIVAPPTPDNVTSITPSGDVLRLTINKNGDTSKQNAANAETVNTIALENGATYKIKFKRYVKDNPSAPSSSGNLIFRFVKPGSPNGDQSYNLGIATSTNLNRWIEDEITFIADSDTYVDSKLRIVAAWSAWADIYVDDVVLSKFSERP